MSRIAPLSPPYEPEIQGQFDRIMRGAPPLMLFRVVAGKCPGLREIPRRQPAGQGAAHCLREREIVIDRACARTGCESGGACMSHYSPPPPELTGSRSAPPWLDEPRAMLVRGRTGVDRGGRCAACPRDAR